MEIDICGGRYLQAAWAASYTKNTYLRAVFYRTKARRGWGKAVVAMAHKLVARLERPGLQVTLQALPGRRFSAKRPNGWRDLSRRIRNSNKRYAPRREVF
jgi:hypothetical protein